MIGTGMWTVFAIALAVIDSICFAAAAVFQHRAVRRSMQPSQSAQSTGDPAHHVENHRLGLQALLALPVQPGWLGGVGLTGLGIALHMLALLLAPVSVIQPIGVLGVPMSVVLAARLNKERPRRRTIVPILMCMSSIGVFVWLAASGHTEQHVLPIRNLLVAEVFLLAIVGGAIAIAHRLRGWSRCVVHAVAGALAFGMVAALMRGVGQHIDSNPARLFDLHTLALVGLMALNGLIGGWLVQQAYASGRAEVVLASLTVVDPMIAVIIGLAMLGEGRHLSGGVHLAMIVCGLLAVAGVIVLAKSHPEVAARPSKTALPSDGPTPALEGSQQLDNTVAFDQATRGKKAFDKSTGPLARVS